MSRYYYVTKDTIDQLIEAAKRGDTKEVERLRLDCLRHPTPRVTGDKDVLREKLLRRISIERKLTF